MPKCALRMGPPKPKKLKFENGAAGTQASVAAPITPMSSAPGTPVPEEDKGGKKRKKVSEEMVPLTPLQKAKDMSTKLLKKKSDASNLGLTLQSIPYADALSNEMVGFAKRFELLGRFLESVRRENVALLISILVAL